MKKYCAVVCSIIFCMSYLIIISYTLSKDYKDKVKKIEQLNIQLSEERENAEKLSIVQEKISSALSTLKELKLLEEEKDNERYTEIAYNCLDYIEPLLQYNKMSYFIQYKKIFEDYKDYIERPLTIYDCFTDDEIRVMCKCIETETFECPFEAKVGVANVIINRVEHELFPSDPITVITEPHQFAYYRDKISEDTLLALEFAFEIEDITNGCIGFRSDKKPKKWSGWDYSHTDGYHYFYILNEGD